jgi:predicted membrane chloride channel (bestrophin family)
VKSGKIKIVYGFFVLVLYLMLGILLLLKFLVWQEVPSFRMASFAIVVIAYGIFRGYRTYKEYQTFNEELDEVE